MPEPAYDPRHPGVAVVRLKIDPCGSESGLMVQVTVLKMRAGQRYRVIASEVFPGRVKRGVRVEGVNAQQPGLVVIAISSG